MTKQTFFKKHKTAELLCGVSLFLFSCWLSIAYHFPYFYSTFLIGLCLTLDGIFRFFQFPSIVDALLKKQFLLFLLIIAIPLSFAIDRLYGQVVIHAWIYPFYTNIVNQVLLYSIVYPFGGLSLVLFYFLFYNFFKKIFHQKPTLKKNPAYQFSTFFLKIILLLLPVAFFAPIILYTNHLLPSLTQNKMLYGLFACFLFIEWAFLFDVILLLVKRQTVLYDILSGNTAVILSLIFGGLVSGILNEYVNTFSYEWVYVAQKVPFSNVMVSHVYPVVVGAWIFATIFCVSAYRLLL